MSFRNISAWAIRNPVPPIVLFVAILFGIALLVDPGMSALVLTWWIDSYTMVFGILLVLLAFRLRGRHAEAGRPGPLGRPGTA